MIMNIEEALLKAIEFENGVYGIYGEAVDTATNPKAIKIYTLMQQEEEQHIAYLEHKLEIWREKNELAGGDLETALPDMSNQEMLTKGLPKGEDHLDPSSELGVLARVYKAESETTAFYTEMVAELPAEGQEFFRQFVAIEEGHLKLVAAEMDAVRGVGRWFDMDEFKLENA
jgi:rubrerythrin